MVVMMMMPVMMMMVMVMDADADAHRADMGANNVGVGRACARTQHCEGEQ